MSLVQNAGETSTLLHKVGFSLRCMGERGRRPFLAMDGGRKEPGEDGEGGQTPEQKLRVQRTGPGQEGARVSNGKGLAQPGFTVSGLMGGSCPQCHSPA